MSPEEKRIAIAEACGKQVVFWKAKYNNHGRPDFHVCSTKEEAEAYPFNELGVESFINYARLPDYLNDLNAMHEAEKIRWIGDVEKLHNDVKTYKEWMRYQVLLNYNIHATASQRADAFLDAIDRYKDL